MMLPERPFPDEGLNGTDFPAKEAESAVKDDGMLSMDDMAAEMETFLRAVVREEVEKVVRCLQSSSRSPFNQPDASGRRRALLKFDKKLPSTIFTGAKIEAEDGNTINIMLLDADTRNIITHGALSSMNVEILAIDGDFGSEDWSEDEFAANIIREREGRRPLIAGELNVSLINGVGQLGEISFTDNSSWQRSRKFRLGAVPVQKNSGVMEARSEAFIVKDHRGELYKKHYPPSLKDEVWRLDRIAKNGAFHKRLASHGIHCVQDFLQLFIRDSSALREVLGGGISNKIWNIIVGHASTCSVDDGKLYTFYEAEQRVGILFDSIHRVVGAMFDGSNYELLDALTPSQKALVDNIIRKAYKNSNSFILFDPDSILSPLRNPQLEQFQSTNLTVQPLGFPATVQSQIEKQHEFISAPGSISYSYDGNASCPFEVSIQPVQALSSPALQQSFEGLDNISHPFITESSGSASNSVWRVVRNRLFLAEETSQIEGSTWPQEKPHKSFSQKKRDSNERPNQTTRLFVAMGHPVRIPTKNAFFVSCFTAGSLLKESF